MTGVAPTRSDVLAVLQTHQSELQEAGVESVTVFGSVARGDASTGSDVDLVIKAGATFPSGGLDYFGRLEELRERLAELLRRDVDLIDEAGLRPRMREIIHREGVRAF